MPDAIFRDIVTCLGYSRSGRHLLDQIEEGVSAFPLILALALATTLVAVPTAAPISATGSAAGAAGGLTIASAATTAAAASTAATTCVLRLATTWIGGRGGVLLVLRGALLDGLNFLAGLLC